MHLPQKISVLSNYSRKTLEDFYIPSKRNPLFYCGPVQLTTDRWCVLLKSSLLPRASNSNNYLLKNVNISRTALCFAKLFALLKLQHISNVARIKIHNPTT